MFCFFLQRMSVYGSSWT